MSSSCPHIWKNAIIWGKLSQESGSGTICKWPFIYQSLTFAHHFICTNFARWLLLLSQIRKEDRKTPAFLHPPSLPSLEGQTGLKDGHKDPFVPGGQSLAPDQDSRGFSNPLP